MKCDIIKQRKPNIEARPVLPAKQPRSSRTDQSGTKSAQYRIGPLTPRLFTLRKMNWIRLCLVLPEQSTEVGDLIQPVPGVLYEDSRLKKGDPRRYQVGVPSCLPRRAFHFLVRSPDTRLDSRNTRRSTMVNVH